MMLHKKRDRRRKREKQKDMEDIEKQCTLPVGMWAQNWLMSSCLPTRTPKSFSIFFFSRKIAVTQVQHLELVEFHESLMGQLLKLIQVLRWHPILLLCQLHCPLSFMLFANFLAVHLIPLSMSSGPIGLWLFNIVKWSWICYSLIVVGTSLLPHPCRGSRTWEK